MATMGAPTTQHRHTKRFGGILTTTHTYLSMGGGELEQKLADVLSREFTMIPKDQQSKAGKAELCNHM